MFDALEITRAPCLLTIQTGKTATKCASVPDDGGPLLKSCSLGDGVLVLNPTTLRVSLRMAWPLETVRPARYLWSL